MLKQLLHFILLHFVAHGDAAKRDGQQAFKKTVYDLLVTSPLPIFYRGMDHIKLYG